VLTSLSVVKWLIYGLKAAFQRKDEREIKALSYPLRFYSRLVIDWKKNKSLLSLFLLVLND
jgi:hypothetical protein